MRLIPGEQAAPLKIIIGATMREGSRAILDGHPSYHWLHAVLGEQNVEICIHSKQEFVNKAGFSTNPAESVFSGLEEQLRAYKVSSTSRGDYHLHLAEYVFRRVQLSSHAGVPERRGSHAAFWRLLVLFREMSMIEDKRLTCGVPPAPQMVLCTAAARDSFDALIPLLKGEDRFEALDPARLLTLRKASCPEQMEAAEASADENARRLLFQHHVVLDRKNPRGPGRPKGSANKSKRIKLLAICDGSVDPGAPQAMVEAPDELPARKRRRHMSSRVVVLAQAGMRTQAAHSVALPEPCAAESVNPTADDSSAQPAADASQDARARAQDAGELGDAAAGPAVGRAEAPGGDMGASTPIADIGSSLGAPRSICHRLDDVSTARGRPERRAHGRRGGGRPRGQNARSNGDVPDTSPTTTVARGRAGGRRGSQRGVGRPRAPCAPPPEEEIEDSSASPRQAPRRRAGPMPKSDAGPRPWDMAAESASARRRRRRAAVIASVPEADPILARLVPAARLKARSLLEAKQIGPITDHGSFLTAWARSGSDPSKEYLVVATVETALEESECRCECDDWRYNQTLCKHGAATLMKRRDELHGPAQLPAGLAPEASPPVEPVNTVSDLRPASQGRRRLRTIGDRLRCLTVAPETAAAPLSPMEPFLPPDLLGGRHPDVPMEVHNFAVSLLVDGVIQQTTMQQRMLKHNPRIRGPSEFAGILRFGYISPDFIWAPRGYDWKMRMDDGEPIYTLIRKAG